MTAYNIIQSVQFSQLSTSGYTFSRSSKFKTYLNLTTKKSASLIACLTLPIHSSSSQASSPIKRLKINRELEEHSSCEPGQYKKLTSRELYGRLVPLNPHCSCLCSEEDMSWKPPLPPSPSNLGRWDEHIPTASVYINFSLRKLAWAPASGERNVMKD